MTLRTLLERLRLLSPKPEDCELAAIACTGQDGHVSRRAFIGLVGTALAAMTVDPEQLLWSPGDRSILLPTDADVWLYGGNELVTPEWVTKQAAKILEHNLRFAHKVSRDYDDAYVHRGQRIGSEIQVRLPDRYALVIAPVLATDQYSVDLDLDAMQADIARGATSGEIARKFLKPAANSLADLAKADGVNRFADLPHVQGVQSSTRSSNERVSVRGIMDYQISEDRTRMRLDILGGRA